MRRNVMWGLGGFVWLLTSFFLTLRLSFPSEAIADRIRYDVDRQSHGTMALDFGHVGQWRFGVAARDVKLLAIDEGSASEVLVMDRARMRVAMFSLLSEPRVTGDLRFGDGDVDITTTLVSVDKKWVPRTLVVEAEEFPINSLPPFAGVDLEGTGALDLDLDLDAPDGFGTASGSFRIYGRSILISGIGDLGQLLSMVDVTLPVSIDELDVRIEWTEGKGRVVRGVLFSSLLNAEMTGDVTLDPTITRSRVKMQIAMELTEAAAKLAPFLGEVWADGKYHALITGRLGSPSISPERERAARRAVVSPESAAEPTREISAETEAAAREARERRRERARDRAARPGAPDVGRVVGPQGIDPLGGEELVPVDEIPGDEGPEEVVPEEVVPEVQEEAPLEEEAPPPPDEGY